MPEDRDSPQPPPPDQRSLLGPAPLNDMFARGMETARLSGAGKWQPPDLQEAARLFPGYEVLKLLGRGGMGAVYQARQIDLDRLVAIKLLPLEISVDPSFADRFRREARAMARLLHSNIVAVFDFGETPEGHLFFVMEYVEGANLAEVIRLGGLNAEQALAIAEQVCTALAFAHGKGVIHRDIKPANVMIDIESRVKVADFGLARLSGPGTEQQGNTITGTIMGTPDYMAPEQAKGMDVDHRADIYSVGVVLYEMLCREVPKGVFQPPSRRMECDARIDDIVMKAMQQAPERRYQSTTEMKADVAALRSPSGVSGGDPVRVVLPLPASQLAGSDPEIAVMTTAALTVAKRSRVPLIAGTIAAIVAMAAAVSFFLGPKLQLGRPRIVGNAASPAPLAVTPPGETPPTTTPETDANPNQATESWRDALPDLKIVQGKEDQFERTAEGLIMKRGASGIINGTGRRNGAIRIRAVKGGLGRDITLQVRNVASKGGAYQMLLKDEQTAELSRYDGEADSSTVLQEFPLAKAIQPGDAYSMELRIVGSALTASINGQLLGPANDITYSQGDFRVRQLGPESVLVTSLEFLPLPGDPAAAAPAANPSDVPPKDP